MKDWLERLYDRLFGCKHPRMSWVFEKVNKDKQVEQYQTCLDCGKEFTPQVDLPGTGKSHYDRVQSQLAR